MTAVTVPVKEGGFDPVAIDAEADDELIVTVIFPAAAPVSFAVKVPRRRPPEIIRTLPARGRTDVALNVQIQVVFSEPIENSDRTKAAFKLASGAALISGNVQVTVDGLSAVFIPDRDLEPLTSYTLSIDAAIRDQDGDPLGAESTVGFTTAAAGTSTGVTPPGDVIAFVRNGDIYRASLDGSELVNLTNHPKYDTEPAWSPDGTRIAFISSREPGSRIMYHWNVPAERDIYVMNADGSNLIRVTTTGGIGGPPAWSPDGRKLAFADYTGPYVEPSGARSDIAIVDVAIGEPSRRYLNVRRVTNPGDYLDDGGVSPIDVTWSSDGTRIAFSNWHALDSMDIYVVDTDGFNLRRILSGAGALGRMNWGVSGFDMPSWSPDGKKVAVIACEGPWTACASRFIAIADSEGGTLEKLVPDQTDGRFIGGVQWSPDGESIVYSAQGGIRHRRLDGSASVLAIPDANSPAWRPSR